MNVIDGQGSLDDDDLACTTYTNGRAKVKLCEVEVEDFISEVGR